MYYMYTCLITSLCVSHIFLKHNQWFIYRIHWNPAANFPHSWLQLTRPGSLSPRGPHQDPSRAVEQGRHRYLAGFSRMLGPGWLGRTGGSPMTLESFMEQGIIGHTYAIRLSHAVVASWTCFWLLAFRLRLACLLILLFILVLFVVLMNQILPRFFLAGFACIMANPSHPLSLEHLISQWDTTTQSSSIRTT